MVVLDEKKSLLHEQILSQILLTSLSKYCTKLCLENHSTLLILANLSRNATRHNVTSAAMKYIHTCR